MPTACRLSQTLGVYGPSLSVIAESSVYRVFTESLASQSSRVERFSHQRIFSAERHGKRFERFAPARWLGSVTKCWSFKRRPLSTWSLPISQRLKPQSSMPARFCISPSSSAAQRICRSLRTRDRRASVRVPSSKQERVGSHPTPNDSFKRTCLRHAA